MEYIKEHKKLFSIFVTAGIIEVLAAIFFGPILSGLLLSLEAVSLYLYLFVRQSEQVLQPKDGLSELRNIILGFVIAAIILCIPSIIYGAFRFYGVELEWLRGLANITSGMQKIAAPMLLVLVVEYKRKDS